MKEFIRRDIGADSPQTRPNTNLLTRGSGAENFLTATQVPDSTDVVVDVDGPEPRNVPATVHNAAANNEVRPADELPPRQAAHGRALRSRGPVPDVELPHRPLEYQRRVRGGRR